MDPKQPISNADAVVLWIKLLQGDEAAFSSLMRIFSQPMYQYGIRIVNDGEFIEECIQNVFFELWKRREHLSATESVKFYLFKSLRNRVFRDHSKWKMHDSINEEYDFEVTFDIERHIIDQELSQETVLKLKELLNKLSKRQKEIVYLRFYEGLSQEKIAEMMGLNTQSVYNLLHVSIMRLRKHWLKSPVYYCL
ncbi:ECF RNA polymerase sigma factor SigL [compost metagenome]